MKKLFLLLFLLISIPALSEPMTFKEMWNNAQTNIFFDSWHDEIKTYYLHKDLKHGLKIIDEIASDKHPKGTYDGWDDDVHRILDGFIAGIIEDNFDIFGNKTKRDGLPELYPENKKLWDVFYPAAWTVFGDGDVREEKLFKHKIKNWDLFDTEVDELIYFSGYYYATGNLDVIKLMRVLIQKNESNLCSEIGLDDKKFPKCPNDSEVKVYREMLALKYLPEKEKKEYQDKIQKAQTEECQRYRKEGPCLGRKSIYIISEFLKRNDTEWYNENIRDWFIKKEETVYKPKDIEELKEIEIFRQKEREYQAKLKRQKEADERLRKMGWDPNERVQGINLKIFDTKTGKFKSLDEHLNIKNSQNDVKKIAANEEDIKKEISENKKIIENIQKNKNKPHECKTQKDCSKLGKNWFCDVIHSSIGQSYCRKANPDKFIIDKKTYYHNSKQDILEKCTDNNISDVLTGCWSNSCFYTYQSAQNYCQSIGKKLVEQKTFLKNCDKFLNSLKTQGAMDEKFWTNEITPVRINNITEPKCSSFPHERKDGYCPTGKVICN